MRFLNIEVALGLIALGAVASRLTGTPLPVSWFVVVPLTTWAVYTLDRIIDSRHPERTPNTGRHGFHARHRRPLLIGVVFSLLTAGITAVAFFPLHYWLTAVGLGILTILHLALQRTDTPSAAVIKDLNVVITFTLSAWAIPLADGALAGTLVSTAHVWLPALWATLALVMVDVLLLSLIDRDEDAGAGRPSISVVLGTTGTYVVIGALCIGVALTSVLWLFPAGYSGIGTAFIVMTACYGLLTRVNAHNPDVARLIVESVLIMPLFALL